MVFRCKAIAPCGHRCGMEAEHQGDHILSCMGREHPKVPVEAEHGEIPNALITGPLMDAPSLNSYGFPVHIIGRAINTETLYLERNRFGLSGTYRHESDVGPSPGLTNKKCSCEWKDDKVVGFCRAHSDTVDEEIERVLKRQAASDTAPIPMLLTCPSCRERHIDRGEFATKIHHTHACQHCGTVWRPAIVATVGVQFLPGFKDEEKPPATPIPGSGRKTFMP